VWQCDSNMPGWFKKFSVKDRASGLTIVAYQYLRSIRACIRANRPNLPCDAAHHHLREEGTGELECNNTRAGVLDKLYAPATKLGSAYRGAAADFPRLTDDGQPLKISGENLVAVAPATAPASAPAAQGLDEDADLLDDDRPYDRSQEEEQEPEGAPDYALDVSCTVSGATVTCNGCSATERRVRGAPGHLVRVPAAHVQSGALHDQMTDAASAAFVRMREACIASGTIAASDDWLKLVSGYRDYPSQAALWKTRLRALFTSFGCTNWAALAPVVDATSGALASVPPPHDADAWSTRFRAELARAGLSPAGCDDARMRAAAAAEHVRVRATGTLDPAVLAVQIGRKTVAPPGASPHHTGRVLDMVMGHAPGTGLVSSAPANVAWQRARSWYAWLVCNAARFGFYPYNREPWHWEHNPPDA